MTTPPRDSLSRRREQVAAPPRTPTGSRGSYVGSSHPGYCFPPTPPSSSHSHDSDTLLFSGPPRKSAGFLTPSPSPEEEEADDEHIIWRPRANRELDLNLEENTETEDESHEPMVHLFQRLTDRGARRRRPNTQTKGSGPSYVDAEMLHEYSTPEYHLHQALANDLRVHYTSDLQSPNLDLPRRKKHKSHGHKSSKSKSKSKGKPDLGLGVPNYDWEPFQTFTNGAYPAHPPPSRGYARPILPSPPPSPPPIPQEKERRTSRDPRNSSTFGQWDREHNSNIQKGRTFSEYWQKYTSRDVDARRRYRDYIRPTPASPMMDPQIAMAGMTSPRRNDPVRVSHDVSRPYPRPEPRVEPAAVKVRESRHHQNSSDRDRERDPERRHRSSRKPYEPIPVAVHEQEQPRQRLRRDPRYPESLYYLGTDSSPPLFLSRAGEAYRDVMRENRGVVERRRTQAGCGYAERKAVPLPSEAHPRGLRRMRAFWGEVGA